jgi:head-tail adaptor
VSDAVGALRVRLGLQSPERIADDLGGASIVWTAQGEVWAEVSASGGAQGADFDRAPSVVSYVARVRAPCSAEPAWRALWGARVLAVRAVRDAGGDFVELICEEERT